MQCRLSIYILCVNIDSVGQQDSSDLRRVCLDLAAMSYAVRPAHGAPAALMQTRSQLIVEDMHIDLLQGEQVQNDVLQPKKSALGQGGSS